MDTKIIITSEILFFLLTLIIIYFIFLKKYKKEKVNCAGIWTDCGKECTKIFKVIQKSENGGNKCEYNDNSTHWCEPGEGKCLGWGDKGEKKSCEIKDIPSNSNINNCPSNHKL